MTRRLTEFPDHRPNAKLTWDKAQEIRRRYAQGETQVALAREFSVHVNTVWEVIHRLTWRTPKATA